VPEVVSGEEEAALSFTGATRELGAGEDGPYLVTDIGGGSTELASDAAGPGLAHISVNIGCVRLTERHLHSDPPTAGEIAATKRDIDATLEQVATVLSQSADVPVTTAKTLVGLAGSVTTIAGIALGLDEYDSARIHHSRVSAGRVHEIAERLLGQTRAERGAIGVMHPGRVDVIGGGALILDAIMTRFGFAAVLVSEHDILDGIAWSLVP
jgi:exopolyphosphatase/guanosine-5'-triphosphate,3'-diphosphate pyrophosphatase